MVSLTYLASLDLAGMGLIFCARVLDVSIGTFRLLLLVRGKRFFAASLGFVEVMVYMLVLGSILGGGKSLDFPHLLAYCAGYATGNYLGSLLEETLMRGFVLLELIADGDDEDLAVVEQLRSAGFGATVIRGEGKCGGRCIVKVVCSRKDVDSASLIIGNRGFVVLSDVRGVWRGYFRGVRK
ncbi:MAG TPA: DUF5698 domain-containing protein [Synergistaceae bacterium]|nr:DUF5698 domain-containing protein [Synergistaceae bacterium]HQH78148.1 DUF5698 domain-containing protein [Synergistaceae bacterium]HQK24457.1 DUF5698 domain-containing protein [Synergistaceae bacterium]